MLCQVCQNIDMRYLKESINEAVINDPGNNIFWNLQKSRPDVELLQTLRQHGLSERAIKMQEEEFRAWEETGDPHRLYYHNHVSCKALLASALAGCHICKLIRYGFSRDSSVSFDEASAETNKPVVLVMHRYDDGRHWTDAPPGEWLHVRCGRLHCSLEIARSPSGEKS